MNWRTCAMKGRGSVPEQPLPGRHVGRAFGDCIDDRSCSDLVGGRNEPDTHGLFSRFCSGGIRRDLSGVAALGRVSAASGETRAKAMARFRTTRQQSLSARAPCPSVRAGVRGVGSSHIQGIYLVPFIYTCVQRSWFDFTLEQQGARSRGAIRRRASGAACEESRGGAKCLARH